MLNARHASVRKCALAVSMAAAVPLFLSAVGCCCSAKPRAPEEKPKAAVPAPEDPKTEHPK